MSRCTVCVNPQVEQINVLLASGSSRRQVARLHGLVHSTVARHARHIAPTSGGLALIRGEGGANAPADPLAEAFLLAERARTPRERLRALEQVRAATRLRMRGLERPDEAERALLDSNVVAAEEAYRTSPDFESQARGLSGWREALLQRLEATPAGAIETALVVTLSEGTPMGPPTPVQMSPAHYWAKVPQRFRSERYTVHRTISLVFGAGPPGETITVRDRDGVIAWKHETPPRRRPAWEEES